jgi:general secretion pathway protein C
MKQEDGTMKQVINAKYFSTAIFILSIIVLAKLIWLAISLFFLPSSGVEYAQNGKAKALYYRVKLTNSSAVIAPVVHTAKKKPVVSSMRGIKLLALYNDSDTTVVTVIKGSKTKVLGKGEKIDGFTLTSAGSNYAIFTKAEKEFKLSLINIKNSGKSSAPKALVSNNEGSTKEAIVEEGGVKRIKRDLLTSYTKDVDKIWKDIGISENKISGKINGFKINFVKKGSDFEKLGLKRGDILMGLNGEELNSYGAAMGFFKDINNIENLTLTVERDGATKEIEYEIQ